MGSGYVSPYVSIDCVGTDAFVRPAERSSAASSLEPNAFGPAPTAAPLPPRFQPPPARCASWIFLWRTDEAAPRRLRDSVAERGRTSGSPPESRWPRATPSGELRRGGARGGRFPGRSARG